MRIIVTGSRDWSDANVVGLALYEAIESTAHRDITVVHGACPTGADRIASEFCESEAHWLEAANTRLAEERHPADWRKHGKAAGFRRNAEMVAAGADICLAFICPCSKRGCPDREPHGSHGASHTVTLAERAGIPVRRFPRPGRAGDAV